MHSCGWALLHAPWGQGKIVSGTKRLCILETMEQYVNWAKTLSGEREDQVWESARHTGQLRLPRRMRVGSVALSHIGA